MTNNGSKVRRSAHRKKEPTPKPGFNVDESPLTWLASRKDKEGRPILSEVEFNAGEKLRADFFFAAMTPRVTTNWSRLQSGEGRKSQSGFAAADVVDHVVAARERVGRALRAVGPDLSGILIDVCCHLKRLEGLEKAVGWPQRSAKIILCIALRQLARHYGMLPQQSGPLQTRGILTHWAVTDYRPRADIGPEDRQAPES